MLLNWSFIGSDKPESSRMVTVIRSSPLIAILQRNPTTGGAFDCEDLRHCRCLFVEL